MSKFYLVSMEVVCDVFVEAESAEEAHDLATTDVDLGNCEMIGTTTLEVTGDERDIDRARRHAHLRLEGAAGGNGE